MKQTKFLADLVWIFGLGGHAHQAGDNEVGMLDALQLMHKITQGLGRYSEFMLLLGDMHLQEDSNLALGRCGSLLNFIHKAHAVHRMDGMNMRGNGFDFVRLQVAYKMPFAIRGHGLGLFLHFQGVIFSEGPLALLVQGLDLLERSLFGNGNQIRCRIGR